MPKQNSTAANRKLRSSYVTTTISISLMLFLLGVTGLLLLNANKVSRYVKENLGLVVMIKNDAAEPEIRKIEKTLSTSEMVKEVVYVDKDRAAEQLKEQLGEDFVETISYNPLLSSLQVKLYADYATAEGMDKVKEMIAGFPEVEEVYYQRNMVALINENVRTISLTLLAFSILLLVVAVTLINNTVRLMVYSRRFLIRTMQLVGATNGFVRRPFITQSVMQGLIGGVIANLLLSAVIYLSARELSGVISFDNIAVVGVLFAAVLIIGILITFISTVRSVNRYLTVRTADLYV